MEREVPVVGRPKEGTGVMAADHGRVSVKAGVNVKWHDQGMWLMHGRSLHDWLRGLG